MLHEEGKTLESKSYIWLYTSGAVEKQNPLGGSKFSKAVNDALNQKPYKNYLKDGRCSISNNAAERAVKSYVMGRKNFLFRDTVKGATASAMVRDDAGNMQP